LRAKTEFLFLGIYVILISADLAKKKGLEAATL
jgi:hypothetical protein